MPSFTITGIDNEFAASTGSNVDTTENSSTFDNPPQGSKDLVITTHADDPDPRLFEIGDTYDISWGGQGGGGTILNAIVVRSDEAPGGGGIIVFEGVDENGDPAQIIWTPGFDLEGWYNDNFNPSMEPQFYTEDTNSAYTHTYVCFDYTTLIATPTGERQAGNIQQGDLVSTLDLGDVKTLWVGKRLVPGTGPNAPVVFEPGSIGNRRQMRLSQQHRVLIKSPFLELLFGLPEALVPAKGLINGDTVYLKECDRICYVHILLEQHHVLSAEGAHCESLFFGDQAICAIDQTAFTNFATTDINQMQMARPVLSMKEAQLFTRHSAATRTSMPLFQTG